MLTKKDEKKFKKDLEAQKAKITKIVSQPKKTLEEKITEIVEMLKARGTNVIKKKNDLQQNTEKLKKLEDEIDFQKKGKEGDFKTRGTLESLFNSLRHKKDEVEKKYKEVADNQMQVRKKAHDEMEAKVKLVQEELQGQMQVKAQVKDENEQYEKQIEFLKTKYEENENDINKEITQRIQDMKNIEDNLKKTIEEKAHSIYKEQEEELKKNNLKMKESIEKLTRQLVEHEKTFTKSKANFDKTKDEIEKVKVQMEEKTKRLEDIVNEIKTSAEKIQESQQNKKNLSLRMATLMKQKENLTSLYNSLKEKVK